MNPAPLYPARIPALRRVLRGFFLFRAKLEGGNSKRTAGLKNAVKRKRAKQATFPLLSPPLRVILCL